MKIRNSLFAVLFMLGLFAMITQVKAQSAGVYTITRSTLDGGGTDQASDGVYTISATIGQWDTGVASIGNYTVHSGFWTPNSTTVPTSIQLTQRTTVESEEVDLTMGLSIVMLFCGGLTIAWASRRHAVMNGIN